MPTSVERRGSTLIGLPGSMTVSVSTAMWRALRARATMRPSACSVSTVV